MPTEIKEKLLKEAKFSTLWLYIISIIFTFGTALGLCNSIWRTIQEIKQEYNSINGIQISNLFVYIFMNIGFLVIIWFAFKLFRKIRRLYKRIETDDFEYVYTTVINVSESSVSRRQSSNGRYEHSYKIEFIYKGKKESIYKNFPYQIGDKIYATRIENFMFVVS